MTFSGYSQHWYTECHNSDYYAACRYAECRGAKQTIAQTG